MKNPSLPDSLWAVLNHRLWHATCQKGLRGIVKDGEIRIVGSRYQNSLCRYLSCVSLFDFGPTAINDWGQFNNWHGWFGSQQDARVAVWLEVDRDATAIIVHDAGAMHRISKKNRSKRFIPGVEAGHKGSIPLDVLTGAVLIDRYDKRIFKRYNEVNETLIGRVIDFKESLSPPPKPDPYIAILEAAQDRARKKS